LEEIKYNIVKNAKGNAKTNEESHNEKEALSSTSNGEFI